MSYLYAVALGSNRPQGPFRTPAAVVEAAITRLDRDYGLFDASPIILNPATGGAGRDFANAVALIEASTEPKELLRQLKAMERSFGRRSGRRWGARVLDLDIVLWSGGIWCDPALAIPHPEFRTRAFMLAPAVCIAPRWRDPLTGLTLRQLSARLTRPRPLPIARRGRALSSVGRATDF